MTDKAIQVIARLLRVHEDRTPEESIKIASMLMADFDHGEELASDDSCGSGAGCLHKLALIENLHEQIEAVRKENLDCVDNFNALKADYDLALKDAERYRWLAKEHGWWLITHFPAVRPYVDASEVIGESIDAEMKGQA